MTLSYKEFCIHALGEAPMTCMELSCRRFPGRESSQGYVSHRMNLRSALLGLEQDGLIERSGLSDTGTVWKLKERIPDTVYIDIRNCGLTLGQMMAEVGKLIREHPDEEIFMDGDAFAIVGRKRTGVIQ